MQQQTEHAAVLMEAGLAVAGLGAAGLTATGLAETGLAEAGFAGTGLAGSRGSETERKRVEAVVETLANLRGRGDNLVEVAHDARNMVTALGLYCDLLEEPGVLAAPFVHYASELRLVATASRRLMEKLLALDLRQGPVAEANPSSNSVSSPLHARIGVEPSAAARPEFARMERARRWDLMPAEPIDNLAAELLANRNLLSALAGPSIALTVDAEGGALPVRLTGEDLTRILVNLVKNAAEAMPDGGRIQLGLRQLPGGAGAARSLMLTVEDNGPGISAKVLERIFDSGYTTRSTGASRQGGWPASHRGLGLSIARSIIEAAGGSIHAANRASAGARLEIELPIRSR
jgi:signal transduction histidine kinase